jgi:hypothetical protein
MVGRNGRVRSKPMERVNRKTVQAAIRGSVHWDSHIMTVEWSPYQVTGAEFAGGYEIVNHGHKDDLRGEAGPNTVECYFALRKEKFTVSFPMFPRITCIGIPMNFLLQMELPENERRRTCICCNQSIRRQAIKL